VILVTWGISWGLFFPIFTELQKSVLSKTERIHLVGLSAVLSFSKLINDEVSSTILGDYPTQARAPAKRRKRRRRRRETEKETEGSDFKHYFNILPILGPFCLFEQRK
jgi:hypothetical protein